jgi:hypothetical protein
MNKVYMIVYKNLILIFNLLVENLITQSNLITLLKNPLFIFKNH